VSGKWLILSLSKLDSIYTNDGLLAPMIDSAHNPIAAAELQNICSASRTYRASFLTAGISSSIHIQSDFGDPFAHRVKLRFSKTLLSDYG
jgi:hypothetical protein